MPHDPGTGTTGLLVGPWGLVEAPHLGCIVAVLDAAVVPDVADTPGSVVGTDRRAGALPRWGEVGVVDADTSLLAMSFGG